MFTLISSANDSDKWYTYVDIFFINSRVSGTFLLCCMTLKFVTVTNNGVSMIQKHKVQRCEAHFSGNFE